MRPVAASLFISGDHARRSRLSILAASVVIVALAGCQPTVPKGQVLAAVNGEEITTQDVATERRFTAGGAELETPALLQKVVNRVLLAQAAHARKLDTDPDYPAELARLQQEFLAQKMVQATVKAPAPPNAAQVAQAIASHPYQFAERSRIQVRQFNFQGVPAWTAVRELADPVAVASRLKALGVPFEQVSRTIDTAVLPRDLAGKLATQPLGKLFFIRQGDFFVAMVVTDRTSVSLSQDEQKTLAIDLVQRENALAQVRAVEERLNKAAKITYQPGFKPTTTVAAGSPANRS